VNLSKNRPFGCYGCPVEDVQSSKIDVCIIGAYSNARSR
jgi:hypothetical protein